MATTIHEWSDGSSTVVVERLVAGEVGLRVRNGPGVILTDDAVRELASVLWSTVEDA